MYFNIVGSGFYELDFRWDQRDKPPLADNSEETPRISARRTKLGDPVGYGEVMGDKSTTASVTDKGLKVLLSGNR